MRWTQFNGTLALVRVAGIAVGMASKGRPTARLVVVDDVSGTPTITASESIPSREDDLPSLLHDLADAAHSRLQGLAVDRVAIRRADWSRFPSNDDGPRLRLLAEGAVTGAARGVVVDTHIGTGKDTGRWYGSDKAGLDADAKALVLASGVAASFAEATAAGLAGLRL